LQFFALCSRVFFKPVWSSPGPESQKQKLDASISRRYRNTKPANTRRRISVRRAITHAPNSFAIHELMDWFTPPLSECQSHRTPANRGPLAAGSAVARTNLATTLFHAGKASLAGEQFRKALELEPKDFDANIIWASSTFSRKDCGSVPKARRGAAY